MSYYEGKTVLITGASSGIGAALSRELAQRGANLVLAARRRELLESLAAELERAGRGALAVSCDVTQRNELDAAIAAAKARFGRVDVVVANAGFGVDGNVEELSVEDFRRQFETNVFGVLETVYASLDELRKNRGALALVGSVMGHLSLPGSSTYAMSKFAVTALAESLWYELGANGVSVTLISPGFIASEIRMVGNDGKLRAGGRDPVPAWLVLPASKAARQIANAIARRRREKIITFHGKLAVFLYRHVPWLVRAVVRLAASRG